MSRTRSPTLTASSTMAASILGVDTETSTPQESLNSHSLAGLFTRATTRRTANSVFASSATTRLALSSPVAAITTSHCSIPDSSRIETSQASPSTQSACSTACGSNWSASRSISITWWPASSSSVAIERPTAPAPAIATRITGPPPGRVPPRWSHR